MDHRNGRERGFTFIELVFTIAIILTLIGIFAPLAMDKLAQSKTARAQADIDAIAAALTNFFSDLGHFPACNANTGGDCDPQSNSVNDLRFLAVCTGSGSCEPEYPTFTGGGATWDLTTNQQGGADAPVNNAYNHLVANNPNINATEGESGLDYRTTKWKGPYITKLAVDPFGKAYIIHVGAMQKTGTAIASGKGWILSAGPDGNLDTAPTDTTLQNDDIGYIFCTNC